MKRFDAHIGSIDSTLQEAPEVFETIGMNLTVDVFDRVIDNLMGVLRAESTVGHEGIGIECGASFDMLPHVALYCSSLTVGHHGGLDLSTAFQESHHSGLIASASPGDAALALANVHVAGLATDESLIDLNLSTVAAQLREGTILHGLANTVQHEPCCLLGDAERPGNLAGANAVLGSDNEPNGREPSFKTKRRILKDGSHLRSELALCMATLALPLLLVRQIGNVLAATGRAFHAFGPAVGDHVGKAVISICEVDDGLLKCLWRSHVLRIGELT